MEPGGSYDIEIAIPADHVPGTNWYHPHHHGSADVQLASGCVGALIIDGDFEGVPEITAARERTLVMTEPVFDAFGTIEDFSTIFPEGAQRFLAINAFANRRSDAPAKCSAGASCMPAGRTTSSWSLPGTR
jgi:FtsP/CotA-like multicopper oxidase with cupredoxin domain